MLMERTLIIPFCSICMASQVRQQVIWSMRLSDLPYKRLAEQIGDSAGMKGAAFWFELQRKSLYDLSQVFSYGKCRKNFPYEKVGNEPTGGVMP